MSLANNSPLLKILLTKVADEFSLSPPVFEKKSLEKEDVDFLRNECSKPSEFDPHNRRKYMFDKMYNGESLLALRKCKYGDFFVILENEEQNEDIPWDLWARILRVFNEDTGSENYFKIYFLANDNLREFPAEKEHPIKPENINGGYTYPCNKHSIVIYRAEDATRVLIHELMHASCLDKHELGINIVEAETEAWAELIYITLLSQGKKYIFNSLLQRQSEYMRKQNMKVLEYMKTPTSFPWRYTIGKEEVWKRWGILVEEDSKPFIHIGKSLRLTYPPTKLLKDRFGVSTKSTIL